MVGASLSKWTMSYFAAALVTLIATEGLMAVGFGFPTAPIRAPETLFLVHLTAIGWLSLLMLGALFQFVPVLIARPLYSDWMPLPILALLLAGLAALLAGFLQLGGMIIFPHSCFAAASLLLAAGIALAVWNLGRTLWDARPLPISASFVTVGLASIAATALLGVIFALTFGGVISDPILLRIASLGIPIHAVAGLGGWLSLTAIGVSYRLLAMFMLAPELERLSTKAGFYLGTTALIVTVVGGVFAIVLSGNLEFVLLAAGAAGLAGLALYGGDVIHLYRARKRRNIELNSRMAALSLASLAACAALIIVLLAFGKLADHIGAVVFLAAFGWLSGLGLAQLYKIVAFLTWLECYGPVLGKAPTPRVQDLVVDGRANKWFLLYFAAVWAGTVMLLAGYLPAFQTAAAAMLVATAGILVQLVRARRLADVKPALRFPPGMQRPRLLFSLSHQT